MLNQITIMGRLTAAPELRKTNGGTSVTSFTLACERDRKDQSGQKVTDFIDIVAFGHTAEFVTKYFAKGQQAAALGRLQMRDWTDKDGNKRRSAEIVADSVYFADTKKSSQAYGATGAVDAGYGNPYSEFTAADDEEWPF